MALWLEKIDEHGNVVCSGKFSNGIATVDEKEITISEARDLVRIKNEPPQGDLWIIRIR